MRIIHILGRFTSFFFAALAIGAGATVEYTRDRLHDLREVVLDFLHYRPDTDTALFFEAATRQVDRDDSRSSAFMAFIRRALRHDYFSAGQFRAC